MRALVPFAPVVAAVLQVENVIPLAPVGVRVGIGHAVARIDAGIGRLPSLGGVLPVLGEQLSDDPLRGVVCRNAAVGPVVRRAKGEIGPVVIHRIGRGHNPGIRPCPVRHVREKERSGGPFLVAEPSVRPELDPPREDEEGEGGAFGEIGRHEGQGFGGIVREDPDADGKARSLRAGFDRQGGLPFGIGDSGGQGSGKAKQFHRDLPFSASFHSP